MYRKLLSAGTPRPIKEVLAKAWRDERGAITIEFVMWFPAIAGILALITDISFVFLTNASMWDSARDAARRLALHKITTEQAERHVRESIYSISDNFVVSASEDEDEVFVLVQTPIRDASVFGVFYYVLTGDLVARVTMLKEPE